MFGFNTNKMLSIVSEYLNDIISTNDSEFTDYVKFALRILSAENKMYLFDKMSNQGSLNFTTINVYSQKISEDKLEYITKFADKDIYPFTFSDLKDSIKMEAIHPGDLETFIAGKDNVFLPVLFRSDKIGMHSLLLFINKQQEVYLVDSNNRPNYFNSIFNEDVTYKLEKMIENYFQSF